MTLPAGSYLGQVGVFAPLMGLSAADVHNIAKARALGDAGLSGLGVVGLGDTIGTILCAGGTAAGGLYTGGGTFSASAGSGQTSSSWTSGWGTAVADAIGTGIAAAACPPTVAPAPAPAPAPPPGYPAPSIVYVPAPQQAAPNPLLQPRQGIDQNTLLIVGGLIAAAIVAVVILK